MNDSRIPIILIVPWPSRHMEARRLLRDLFEDLRHEQISVLPFPPLVDEHPWFWHKWMHRLREFDFEEWEYLFHRWWRYHPDWRKHYPEWRHEIDYFLRRISDRGEPHTIVILAPFSEEAGFDQADLDDFVRIVEPAVIIYLRIGEADRPIAEPIPHAKVLNYPEGRSELLHLLRSITTDTAASQLEHIAARHEMVRSKFAERTADQERPKITAAYPEAIAPSCWFTLEVFLYLRNYRELVKTEIQRLQDRENIDYSGVSSEFPKSLPAGCPIRVSLQSNSLRINPSELTINWYEPYNRLPFRISPIHDEKDGYSASLDIDVFADDLPVASMRLAIAVNSNVPGEHITPSTSDAVWYEDIFASYAREDLELVKHLKKRYEALGLYMFIDLEDLRSGTFWRTDLAQRIDDSDLFQLFWSDHARQSKYVAIEWKHALRAREIKGGRFIRPVYWHDPIPTVPEELAEINFRKISFVET